MTTHFPRPEDQLLALCARLSLDPAALRPLLAQSLDWDYLVLRGAQQRVLPLVWRHLNEAAPDAVPPALREQFGERARANSRLAMMLVMQLREVAAPLLARNLPFVAHQGPLPGMRLYGNLALREADELQLWLRPNDLEAAAALLQAEGYEPVEGEPRALLNTRRYVHEFKVHLEARDDFDVVWPGAEPWPIVGQRVPVLGVVDWLAWLGRELGARPRLQAACDLSLLRHARFDDVLLGALSAVVAPEQQAALDAALGLTALLDGEDAGPDARELLARMFGPLQGPRVLAPFVPTQNVVVERMLELAEVGPSDVIYDLGCGDGRIVIAAAQRFGTRGVGVELDPGLVETARQKAREAGVEHLVRFDCGDARALDFSEASVVALYIGWASNLELKPLLQSRLKPGSRVVSHVYGMGDWQPERIVEVEPAPGHRLPLFLWRI